jgi:2'-5' RNA ligase
MHRLFIAIDFIADSVFLKHYQKTASVFTKLDRYNLVKPELMHITLKFLGETETEKIHSAVQGMQQAVKNIPVLDLKTGKTGIFGSRYQPRVLWIEIEKTAMLEQLHQQLQKEMRKTGFKSDFGNFVPHLTLARINKIDDKRYFWKKMESIPQDFVQHIHADKIILYESILTGYVPVYRKLEEIFLSNA